MQDDCQLRDTCRKGIQALRCLQVMTDTTQNSGNAPDWDLLARWLAGEANQTEARAIEACLPADPARHDAVAAVRDWMDRQAFQQPADLDVEAALRSVKAR